MIDLQTWWYEFISLEPTKNWQQTQHQQQQQRVVAWIYNPSSEEAEPGRPQGLTSQ